MPGYLDDSWKPVIEQLVRWRKNFRISGDGVSFTNTPDGATATVRQQGGGTTTRLPLGVTFAVKLSAPGTGAGSNGTKTAAATYKYVVKDLADNVLYSSDATPIDTSWPRPNGTMTRASLGHAWWDTDGSLKIVAYETPGTASC